jgi:hypothetical protein
VHFIAWPLRIITSLDAVKSINYKLTQCDTFSQDPADLRETDVAGSTVLRYDDATSNEYIYNWKAPSQGCYTLFLTLDTGQVFTAYFNLGK